MTRERTGGASVFDGPRIFLLVVTFALILLGLVMVYSASMGEAVTNGTTDSSYYLLKQAVIVVIGSALGTIAWKFCPPHLWRGKATWFLFAFCVVLLVATAVYGVATNGAQRWVYIGSFSFQPSEVAKVVIIIVGARIYADFREGLLKPRTAGVLAFCTVIAPVLFLFVAQSDLGTTLIIAIGLVSVLWFGECPLEIIAIICAVGVAFVLIAIFGTDYRSNRLYNFDPWNDGQNGGDRGFQLVRSFYAFAQGGVFGAGIGNSTEKLTPLPEAETDFIFAIIGEELGLVGALLVIALFAIFLVAGMLVANESEDPFARMLAGSLTVVIVFQAFLNMGCVTGLLPTTGKPLPFISSGGSSMFITLIMVGLIMTAAPTGSKTSIYDKRRENLRIVRSVDSDNARYFAGNEDSARSFDGLRGSRSLGDNGRSQKVRTFQPVALRRGRR